MALPMVCHDVIWQPRRVRLAVSTNTRRPDPSPTTVDDTPVQHPDPSNARTTKLDPPPPCDNNQWHDEEAEPDTPEEHYGKKGSNKGKGK